MVTYKQKSINIGHVEGIVNSAQFFPENVFFEATLANKYKQGKQQHPALEGN